MKQLDWYFDLISPFAYLQSTQLARFAAASELRCVPVVFAGLLQHFGNVGPAEIAPKRQWTFEHVAWTAQRMGLPMRRPAAHPFNPVAMLRSVVAAGSSVDAVQAAYRYVWEQGGDLTDLSALHAQLGISAEQASAPAVKAQLIANGQAAIAAGVFGVPTSRVDGRNFWGADATDMVSAYLAGDPWFRSAAYTGVSGFPNGVQRVR